MKDETVDRTVWR